MPGLTNPIPADSLQYRQQNDFDIKPECPVINIPDIMGKFLFPGDGIPPVYLGPASQAGLDFMATGVSGE